MENPVIAIVGAGFSGTLVALHLLRRCPAGTGIRLIERNAQFGRGQAYSTGNPGHLLNVPAGRMSAFPDQPSHFLDWMRRQPGHADAAAGDFMPRQQFGAYVRQLLNDEMRRSPNGARLELVRGDVLSLQCGPRVEVMLDRGRRLTADAVVLAVGTFPPEPPPVADPAFYDTDAYRPDPWAPEALDGLDPADPVLLIGTGLTMVDTMVSLLDRGHAGPIHALSRRGLLPHRHNHGGVAATGHAFPSRVNALLRTVRLQAKAALAAGDPWQPSIDALRPFTADLWQSMPLGDRKRFLRHLRPWWDVHRHRLSDEVADRIAAARTSGQLRISAGRISEFRPTSAGDRVNGQSTTQVIHRMRGGGTACVEAARVINCSGPTCDYDRVSHPLIRSLLAGGQVRPDALRLGLDVTASGTLLGRDGAVSRRLFALGPVTRSTFWEMTAVPDIRRQAELLATYLAALIRPTAVARVALAAVG